MIPTEKIVRALGIQMARQTRMRPAERKYLRMLARLDTLFREYKRTRVNRYFFDYCDQLESLHRFVLISRHPPEVYLTWSYHKPRLYSLKSRMIDAFMNRVISKTFTVIDESSHFKGKTCSIE